ncbi:Protein saf4, partial [Cryomyces antarcticus]
MQGFNMGRYVPPEFEGVQSGNKLSGKHALGARANKIGQGILTVRFEMPFAIWCGKCPKETIIGQGVRFNAEKKKVGNYHSTPIYSFRMKHAACGGWIEIRTDPANTAYVVVEGARKRDTGEDKVSEGDLPILTEEEREQRRNNAFAALEGKVTDLAQAKTDTQRIEELRQVRERDWEDTYAASRNLRASFRAERKKRARTTADTEAMRVRMGLGIELLAETDEDRRRAG